MLSVAKRSRDKGLTIPIDGNEIGRADLKDVGSLFVASETCTTRILHDEIKLPSPPVVAIKILELFRSEHVSIEEISRVVSLDPALAVKVLRMANSPVYTRTNKVETIKKAISVLGMRTLKNIALSFVIVDSMRAGWKGGYDHESLWRKSITSAVATSLLSPLLNKKDEDLFITALLQDVGALILQMHDAEKYNSFIGHADSGSHIEKEREAFGVDHQELGHRFLTKWGLPAGICELVRCHHSRENVQETLLPQLTVLRLANCLSSVFYADHSGHDFEEFTQLLRSVHPARNEEIEQIINEAHRKTGEVLSFFEISPGSMKTCSQILQEANEELGKLNMSYERLVQELRQAKEEAEKYALKLAQANERLRQLAYKDPLTGLFNHGYFQEMLDRENKRAARYKRPFSLLLFDLDYFKNINDRYGHQAGDRVLRVVSDLAMKSVRRCDYVARYGGEEFAIILPETGSEGAVTLAERLRVAIEKAEIKINEHVIKTTISVGVYTYRPDGPEKPKDYAIAAADRALYLSKSMGRNRINASDEC